MAGKNPWKTLGSKTVYRNSWLRLREDEVIRPDGKRGIYGVVELKPAVYIIPLTPRGGVYLIRQHRYTTCQWSWEVPAGGSDGQPLLSAAKRELQEETGLRAKRWSYVGRFQSLNGVSNGWGYIYIARGLVSTGSHQRRAEAITKTKVFPFLTVLRMIRQGTLTDAPSIVALVRAGMKLRGFSEKFF